MLAFLPLSCDLDFTELSTLITSWDPVLTKGLFMAPWEERARAERPSASVIGVHQLEAECTVAGMQDFLTLPAAARPIRGVLFAMGVWVSGWVLRGCCTLH